MGVFLRLIKYYLFYAVVTVTFLGCGKADPEINPPPASVDKGSEGAASRDESQAVMSHFLVNSLVYLKGVVGPALFYRAGSTLPCRTFTRLSGLPQQNLPSPYAQMSLRYNCATEGTHRFILRGDETITLQDSEYVSRGGNGLTFSARRISIQAQQPLVMGYNTAARDGDLTLSPQITFTRDGTNPLLYRFEAQLYWTTSASYTAKYNFSTDWSVSLTGQIHFTENGRNDWQLSELVSSVQTRMRINTSSGQQNETMSLNLSPNERLFNVNGCGYPNTKMLGLFTASRHQSTADANFDMSFFDMINENTRSRYHFATCRASDLPLAQNAYQALRAQRRARNLSKLL